MVDSSVYCRKAAIFMFYDPHPSFPSNKNHSMTLIPASHVLEKNDIMGFNRVHGIPWQTIGYFH